MIFRGCCNKTIIPHGHVEYEIIIANYLQLVISSCNSNILLCIVTNKKGGIVVSYTSGSQSKKSEFWVVIRSWAAFQSLIQSACALETMEWVTARVTLSLLSVLFFLWISSLALYITFLHLSCIAWFVLSNCVLKKILEIDHADNYTNNKFKLSFDAFYSWFSLAESPAGDLQVTALK